mmetsp:Transcript_42696/g.83715  ORF Transcript_42696/g.83715 Transcript_42696/m.83715 type:complete len:164 (+) Transcript_42696:225-716(+)
MYSDEVALKVAAVTKLTRNLFLAAVIPYMTWVNAKAQKAAGDALGNASLPLSTLVPSFIVGFLFMSVVRSTGDSMLASEGLALGLFDKVTWKAGCDFVANDVGKVLLGTAMAAVGLNTNMAVLRGIGAKPFAVGFAGSAVVGTVGFVLATLLGPYVNLGTDSA